jgi:hypothetical protein
MPERVILAFDIGIRNLAWCLLKQGTTKEILGWDNFDLLAGQSASKASASKESCAQCSAKASYETTSAVYCVRHCPIDKPAFRDMSGNLVKKLPSAVELRNLLIQKGVVNPPKSKGDLIKKIREIYALPILKKKVKKAVETELSTLHDSMRKFILDRKELFSKADAILLENQPVLKNPTMKTVQILLYATLRDILQPNPPQMKLVHAKKKVEGKEKGDKGYKDRKLGSELRAAEELPKVKDADRWKQHLEGFTKKNDLTDAFCMCIDSE